MAQQPTDFLEKYILETLQKNGLDNLSETNKQIYLPQLMLQAQQRIGMALMAKLDEKNTEKFVKMMEQGDEYSWEQWQQFWKQAVPSYETVVRETLDTFGEECKAILTGK